MVVGWCESISSILYLGVVDTTICFLYSAHISYLANSILSPFSANFQLFFTISQFPKLATLIFQPLLFRIMQTHKQNK